jgi:hypothetical protein
VWEVHGDRDRPIGQRDGLLAHRLIDRLQDLGVRGEDLVKCLSKVLEEMKPVCDLDGRGGAVTGAFSIGWRAVTRDDLHAWMLPEPLRHGLGRAIWEKRHRLTAL